MSRRSNNICKISRSAIFRVYTTLDRKSEENVDTADTRYKALVWETGGGDG